MVTLYCCRVYIHFSRFAFGRFVCPPPELCDQYIILFQILGHTNTDAACRVPTSQPWLPSQTKNTLFLHHVDYCLHSKPADIILSTILFLLKNISKTNMQRFSIMSSSGL